MTQATHQTARHILTAHEKSVRDFMAGRTALSEIYSDDAQDRIELVREGLPSSIMEALSTNLGLTHERVYRLLGVPRATAVRRSRSDANLDRNATERALFVAGLARMVENMIPEITERAEAFNASRWVAQWLAQPQPALGGKTPESFMDTTDGRALVRRLLIQLETGTYA